MTRRHFGRKKRTVADRRADAVLFLLGRRSTEPLTPAQVAHDFNLTLKVADEVLEKCGRGGDG